MLQRPENEIKVEAIAALAKLADERRADTIRVRLQAVSTSADGTISQAVARAMQELDNRFSTQQIAANQRAEKMQEPAKTLLIDNQDMAKVVKEHEVAGGQAGHRDLEDRATSSRAATSSSKRSARAPSARCCSWKTPWSRSG